MREDDASYRRAAASIVKRDFGWTMLKKPLHDGGTAAFGAMVETATNSALGARKLAPASLTSTVAHAVSAGSKSPSPKCDPYPSASGPEIGASKTRRSEKPNATGGGLSVR